MESKLSKLTIKTYDNQLKLLLKKLNKEEDYLITNLDEVIKFIQKNYDNLGSQITVISSILYSINNNQNINDENKTLLKNNYKQIIAYNQNLINEKNKLNEKNEKESDNWMNWDEILELFKIQYNKYKKLIENPKKMDIDLFYKIQNIIILSLYIYEEPRRSEYIDVKYKNYDIKKDNFFDVKKKIIVLNNYKTSKTKNDFIIDLSKNKTLYNILINFIKLKEINLFNSDYLFISNIDTKLDESQLAKRLNSVFDKKISTSMIRKIYLSHMYGDTLQNLKNLKNTTINMGNSINTVLTNYLKN